MHCDNHDRGEAKGGAVHEAAPSPREGILGATLIAVLSGFHGRGHDALAADHVVDVRRTVELPFAPVPGMILAFADAGEVVISKIRVRVAPPGRLGLLPLEIEVIGTKESLDGLEAALAAGWVAEDALPAGENSSPPARAGRPGA